SHSPKEFTKADDGTNGANVLLNAVIAEDKRCRAARSRESEVPNAPCLHQIAGDAPLRVSLHVDHGVTAIEPVLVRRLEHPNPPVVRVDGDLALLYAPGLRRLHLVTAVVPRVLGELRWR